jgi:hypothetical protein
VYGSEGRRSSLLLARFRRVGDLIGEEDEPRRAVTDDVEERPISQIGELRFGRLDSSKAVAAAATVPHSSTVMSVRGRRRRGTRRRQCPGRGPGRHPAPAARTTGPSSCRLAREAQLERAGGEGGIDLVEQRLVEPLANLVEAPLVGHDNQHDRPPPS